MPFSTSTFPSSSSSSRTASSASAVAAATATATTASSTSSSTTSKKESLVLESTSENKSNKSDDEKIVQVTILRTNDGHKCNVDVDMTWSLNRFKAFLRDSTDFLSIHESVRVFHLGREWRTGGRSLQTLGLGKFENYHIHLTVSKQLTKSGGDSQKQKLQTKEKKKEIESEFADDSNRKRELQTKETRTSRHAVIDLIDSSDEEGENESDDEIEVLDNYDNSMMSNEKKRQRRMT